MQALAPDNTRAYNNLGSAFVQQERFDKATEMYERSLSLDKNATAYSNLGTALYQQGLYADAARSFEGAVALPGATHVHWFNLGAACYWAPDLRARAKEAYEMAVKLGEQTRASSGRPDPSLLAELASGYAVLALLTAGRGSGGASRPCPQAASPDPDAATRRQRPLEACDDLRRAWRPHEGTGMARTGDPGGLPSQEDRTLAVAEGSTNR